MTQITQKQFIDLLCMAEKITRVGNGSRWKAGGVLYGSAKFVKAGEKPTFKGPVIEFGPGGLGAYLPLENSDTYFQNEDENSVECHYVSSAGGQETLLYFLD